MSKSPMPSIANKHHNEMRAVSWLVFSGLAVPIALFVIASIWS